VTVKFIFQANNEHRHSKPALHINPNDLVMPMVAYYLNSGNSDAGEQKAASWAQGPVGWLGPGGGLFFYELKMSKKKFYVCMYDTPINLTPLNSFFSLISFVKI
jgi:hypothetical protein